jgi:triosephosphate isomerase
MHFVAAEAAALASALKPIVAEKADVDVAVCPTYLSLSAVHMVVKGSSLALGAQDVFWMDSGAFTGRISARMLVDVGATYCIVGHSETRGRFGKLDVSESTVCFFAETNETVRLKIEALLPHGIAPILCVGETLGEREAGRTDAVIADQLNGALTGFDEAELGTLVVAYEPVWAIGTGQTCDTVEAERICVMIRSWLSTHFSPELAESTRVLYGGSVKAANAVELFAQPNIDGGLVGGASMKADEFTAVIRAAHGR